MILSRRAFDCLALGSALLSGRAEAEGRKPVTIKIGAAKEIIVTIPDFSKPQLREILATFLARDEPEAYQHLLKVLEGSGDVTLVVTTK